MTSNLTVIKSLRILSVISLLLAAGLSLASCISIPLNRDRPIRYFQVAGSGVPLVYLMRLDGIITGENSVRGVITGEVVPSMVENVRYQLDRLEADGVNPVGILLRINSPGGTVTASDIIYHELIEFKKRRKIPVVVLMMDVAASGGYYVAMTGDTVVAHPTTVTGSLGVIMPAVNLSKLMAEYGVEDTSIASGPLKDLHSVTRPVREKDRAVLQSVVDDLQDRFLEVVKSGRGDRLKKPLKTIADGRIYTANQAKAVGLVDRIGYFEDALAEMRRLTGLTDFRVVTLAQQPDSGQASIYMSRPGGAQPRTAALASLLGLGGTLAPFYYLWLPR